jgi:hypothetical protein
MTAIAARSGGYFATSWGWTALVLGWALLILAVVARELALTRTAALFAAAVAALAVWTWLSMVWSDSPSATALEGERALVYVAGTAALAVVARALGASVVLTGVSIATFLACLDGLATRLFPGRIGTFDPVSGYRLASPVGYWNAMGLVAALGAILAIGFLAYGHTTHARAAAAAALVVYAPTMYFTFSRGAWLAVLAALVALVALSPARLRVCVAVLVGGGVVPAVVVALSSHSPALTTLGADIDSATRQGHRIAFAVVIGAAVAALLGAALERADRRYEPSTDARRRFAALLVAAVVIGAAVVFVRFGSPWHLIARGWHSFAAPPSATVSGDAGAGTNLNQRLFQLSNNNRIVGWRSALHEWQSAPVVGRGAGTFEDWWLVHRRTAAQIRDAHSLYLESLGELGVVGFAIVVLLIVLPLVVAWQYRRTPYVTVAAAAWIAWAVHAGLDWDWEVPAATLPALACGVLCCSSGGSLWRLDRAPRLAVASVGGGIAVFGIVVGIGNQAIANSRDALSVANYAAAQSQARDAGRWAPWLSEPWIIEGQIAALNQDRDGARAAFEKAIAKDPRNYLAWYGLAGVTSGAAHREAVAKVVALNPLSDEAKELSKGP